MYNISLFYLLLQIKLDFELEYGEKSQFLFQRWKMVQDYFYKSLK